MYRVRPLPAFSCPKFPTRATVGPVYVRVVSSLVIVNDSLGIGAALERELEHLVATYACEWRGVVEDPAKRAQFRK